MKPMNTMTPMTRKINDNPITVNTEYDIVALAVNHMGIETYKKIVVTVLEGLVKDTIRNNISKQIDTGDILRKVCEKLQQKMKPEESQGFGAELYEQTRIDARNPKYKTYVPASTIADMQTLIHLYDCRHGNVER